MATPTPIVVKLIRGATSLALTTAPLAVDTDFVPPDVALTPILAAGTSSNRYGGSTKAGERGNDLSWAFTVVTRGDASEAQVRGLFAQIRNFLTGAGNDDSPTYLYYKANSDTSLDPLWGQAAYYYQITQGAAVIDPLYGTGGPNLRAAAGKLKLTLLVKPFALGVAQQVCTATGGLISDLVGDLAGAERGVIVAPPSASTGNLFTNPVFGNLTWNTGWSATAATLTATQNTDARWLLPGTVNSALLTATVNAQAYVQSLTAGNTNTHILSCYVRLPDGSAVSATQCQIYYGSAKSSNYVSLGNGWYRVWASFAAINAGTNSGLLVAGGYTVYATGFMFDNSALLNPLYYGDLLG